MYVNKAVITKERLLSAIGYFEEGIKEVDDFIREENVSDKLREECEEMKTHHSVAFLVLHAALRELYGEE